MSTIAAAAANPIRAMDAAANPLGMLLPSRPAAVTGWAAPFGTWNLGALFDAAGVGSGLTSLPTGVTLPSSAKPQFSRVLA